MGPDRAKIVVEDRDGVPGRDREAVNQLRHSHRAALVERGGRCDVDRKSARRLRVLSLEDAMNYKPEPGDVFGRLVVIRDVEAPEHVFAAKDRAAPWLECLCECGMTIKVRRYNLTNKVRPTRSCGCLGTSSTFGAPR